MKKRYIRIAFLILFGIIFFQCARRGAPSGGSKDEEPPVLLKSDPKLGSTYFKSHRIRLYFDEYVDLRDVRKQLIISPPLKYFPEFTPVSGATKKVEILIKDTLRPSTTYTLNFGNSIKDYNEGNVLPFFKYIFSTGAFIDSLMVEGNIRDAINPEPDKFVTVMLYQRDSLYKDSIIYKEKPMYITNTLDSLTTFNISNVKAGEYMLVAIQDKNNNYIFDPKTDKIGFLNNPINLPTDSLYTLTLFKEIPKYKASRPFQVSENRIVLGYTGVIDSLRIEVLSEVPKNFKYLITKEKEKDSLNYWFQPKLQDSIKFAIHNHSVIDTFRVRLKDMKSDSLQISLSDKSRKLIPGDYLTLQSNIPLMKIDKTKIKIFNKDSIVVPFQGYLLEKGLQYELRSNVTLEQEYRIEVLPKAMTDFFGHSNDTLHFQIKTGSAQDYSTLRFKLGVSVQYPVILQLTDMNGKKVEKEIYAKEPKDTFIFDYIKPNKYRLRIIEDQNENHKWDTGNFLLHLQPERVIYYPKELDLRANWEVEESWL